ncbi:putative ABC transport system permease protein [Variovorax boronicumulans]|uniref:ABC transporter permease n=1 Tax=Variovorax boronicumulans TaxID=436515 RepID=UPI00277F5118|nr:FtsX-like permease family protein [Variovorax boronicumulans]MDQ0086064.1 putative ABC transport system permease protein [Variovorax boronicumulans]
MQLLARSLSLALAHVRGHPAFSGMTAMGIAISLTIVASTLSLTTLGLDATKSKVADAGFDVLQIEFRASDAGRTRTVLQEPVLQELRQAIPAARALVAFSLGDAQVQDSAQIRATQILTSSTADAAALLRAPAAGRLPNTPDARAQICLIDSDQMLAATPRVVWPAGVQLQPLGQFYVQGALKLALVSDRPAMWVPEPVFDALSVGNVRNLVQVRLGTAEYAGVTLASAQARAFFRQRYPLLQVDVFSPWDALGETKDLADRVNQMATLLGLVVAVLSAVAMSNAILVSVKHRQTDIGVRLAIGALPADIGCQLVVETVALAVLGIAAGALVALLVTAAWCAWAGWAWRPVLPALGWTAGIALLSALSASLWPALAAARLDPVAALRR